MLGICTGSALQDFLRLPRRTPNISAPHVAHAGTDLLIMAPGSMFCIFLQALGFVGKSHVGSLQLCNTLLHPLVFI